MPFISGGGGGAGGAISGVTVTGTASAGQVPVASSSSAGQWGFTSGYEIGYDQITAASTSITSTTEATGTTVITCAAHTFDGAAVMVEFFGLVEPSSTSGIIVSLFESSTQISRIAELLPGAISPGYTLTGRFRFTPTAGSHTYTVTAFHQGASNGSIVAGSGGTGGDPPCFVRFTKV